MMVDVDFGISFTKRLDILAVAISYLDVIKEDESVLVSI